MVRKIMINFLKYLNDSDVVKTFMEIINCHIDSCLIYFMVLYKVLLK